MKTVPSGIVDFCMNGALAVYGTIMVGIPAPWIVGSPVSEKGVPPEVVLVASGNVAVVVAEASVVDSAELVAPVVVSPVVSALVADVLSPVVVSPVVLPVVSAVVEASSVVAVANVAVDRFGRSFCACTAVAASSASNAKERTSRTLRAMTVSQQWYER